MPSTRVDLLLHARWVIPIEHASDEHEQVLDQHTVAVNDGRIVAVLPTAQAHSQFQAITEHDLNDHALMPGLVNAHTHAAMALMRGIADDLPLMTWLNEHIWPTEARCLSDDYVRVGTRLAAAEMLRGGITCFNDMYFFPNVVADCVAAVGMRAVIGLIAIDFPSAWANNIDDYLSQGLALREQHLLTPKLHFALAPHAPYTVSAEGLTKIRDLAAEHSLPIHMHVHETAAEVDQFLDQHGCRPLAYLDQLGLLTPRLAAVHMTQLTPGEIEQVANAGVHVLHCPESNLKLASGFCPVAALLDAGVNVAIGTDGAASNNDLNLFGELRTAALLAKAVANDAAAVPAHQALRMATLNGAKALGLDDQIGSLTPGKQADMIAVNLNHPETEPVYHPVSQLAYAVGRHQVSDVWVAGQQLLADSELTTIDRHQVIAQARGWRDRLAVGN